MKYVLDEKYDLCGWKLVPYAIKDKEGNVEFLNKSAFNTLYACEGKVDFALPFFSDNVREYINFLLDRKIVREVRDENDTRKINYKYYDNRYIKEVQFAITGKCNFLCKHCYMSAHSNTATELPLEKVLHIIDEIRDAGVFRISITGGECLIRKDFFTILDYILKSEIKITTIYSNAWLINEKLLDEIEKRGIKPGFSISFDGVGYHDYMRGIVGAEKKANVALELLKKRGYYVDVEMCLFGKNKHTLRETVKHLNSLGVSYIKVNPVARTGEWKKQSKNDDISYNETSEIFLKYIKEYFEDNLAIDIQLSGFFLYRHRGNTYSIPCYKHCTDLENTCVCGHARLKSYITETGVALPCPGLSGYDNIKDDFPSIFDIGFAKCVDDSVYMNFIDKRAPEIIEYNEECKKCKYKENCYAGCRAGAYDSHNDLLAKDEAVCSIYKGGYIKKIQKLMSEIKPQIKFVEI